MRLAMGDALAIGMSSVYLDQNVLPLINGPVALSPTKRPRSLPSINEAVPYQTRTLYRYVSVESPPPPNI